MDHSPLSRRGALAAVAGSAAALTVPTTAHAGTPPVKSGEAPATLHRFLSRLPENQRFRIVHMDKRATPEELEARAQRRKAFGDPYSAHGWDTVSAVRLTDVNRAIAANPGSFPDQFDVKIPEGMDPAKHVSGTLGTWATCVGGSGELLAMETPFEAVIVVRPGEPGQATYTVSGGSLAVQVRLKALAGKPGTNEPHKLMVQTDASNPDQSPLVITGYKGLTVSPPVPVESVEGTLSQALEPWFIANIESFTHIFAEINLSADGTGDMSWLQPTFCGYALHDAADNTLDNSYLGVLNMTENRPRPQGADFEVDSSAILSGQRAGLNISADRFMAKMVIPAMAASWNVSPDNFQLLPDSTVQATSLTLPSVGLPDGTHRTPQVTNLHIYHQEAELFMDMDVTVNISPGIDEVITCQYALAADLVSKDGQAYVSYAGTLLRQTSQTEVAQWVTVLEDVAMAVAVAIPGAQMERTTFLQMFKFLVVAAVTAGIVKVIASIPEFEAGEVPDGLPSTQDLLKNAMVPLHWASATEFVPKVAAFNGGMQLGGDCFVKPQA